MAWRAAVIASSVSVSLSRFGAGASPILKERIFGLSGPHHRSQHGARARRAPYPAHALVPQPPVLERWRFQTGHS
jgi:hypothetical protein